ncbi:MAG TPA: hypothetical protein VH021_16330, partial [Trebonia sp.]|nr:hypothetical protein [Trebonia sp.]
PRRHHRPPRLTRAADVRAEPMLRRSDRTSTSKPGGRLMPASWLHRIGLSMVCCHERGHGIETDD